MGVGGVDLVGINVIFLFGGFMDRLVLFIVLSMVLVVLCLVFFLDFFLLVYSRFFIVILVLNVFWWGGFFLFVILNLGFCRFFLIINFWRWFIGLLCGVSVVVVVYCWKIK